MMNQTLDGTELSNSGDYTAENDFRKIVLLRDPKSDGSAATANTLRQLKQLDFLHHLHSYFSADETITQTGSVQ